MRTTKVNGFTKIMNAFSRSGRNANREISRMGSGSVYQRTLPNNAIALSKSRVVNGGEEDTLVIVNYADIKRVKNTKRKVVDGGYKLYQSVKKILFYEIPASTNHKEMFFNMNTHKVEEIARKSIFSDGPSIKIVKSKSDRQSTFPVTALGKSIRSENAEKKVLSNGDIQYEERYLNP